MTYDNVRWRSLIPSPLSMSLTTTDHSLSPTKSSNRIENIIKRYKNHPSIRKIKANFNSVCIFSFQPVCVDDVKTVIQDLKNNKSVGGEIPIQILKESEFTFETLTIYINISIKTDYFPDSLKEVNITLIFKKDDLLDKSNCRPLSILPLISKVFERLIYNQLSKYNERFLNHILCGFRKAHSTNISSSEIITIFIICENGNL